MDVPPWVKWLALIGLGVWLVVAPKSLAGVAMDLFNGIVTFFKSLG